MITKRRRKKKKKKKTWNFVTSFKIHARLSDWKRGILPGKAPNSPIAVQSREEKSGFVSNPVVTTCDDTMVTRGQGWAWKQGGVSSTLQAP